MEKPLWQRDIYTEGIYTQRKYIYKGKINIYTKRDTYKGDIYTKKYTQKDIHTETYTKKHT